VPRRPGAIDLNADLGEGAGPDGAADGALLEVVTTAHVACGFHAGDPSVMAGTVRAAVAAGVVVGAHPSYPDRAGFGRRSMDRPPAVVADDLAYQLGALQGVARRAGGTVRSVKPHGALYHRVAGDEALALAVAGVVREGGDALVLVLPAGAPALAVASGAGVAVAAEAFCDRGYLADGSLAPRGVPGALVTDPDEAGARAVALVTGRPLTALDGTPLRLDCDTLCVHGDTPGSPGIARAVRRALAGAGIAVRPFAR
jgi:UPF0271 protein